MFRDRDITLSSQEWDMLGVVAPFYQHQQRYDNSQQPQHEPIDFVKLKKLEKNMEPQQTIESINFNTHWHSYFVYTKQYRISSIRLNTNKSIQHRLVMCNRYSILTFTSKHTWHPRLSFLFVTCHVSINQEVGFKAQFLLRSWWCRQKIMIIIIRRWRFTLWSI